ncbi:MAG: bifunctional metallophosphatase/5'-nucleotidase [Prevotellaceae bacterium]|jgi:2',3'-cyclic-nucleotide 2'-phosphodiesterase (5'-nucleotidase family)|nr:bifunctional metallophosphatase/5'-nucleotidase [Prevotellaceae bacterium]
MKFTFAVFTKYFFFLSLSLILFSSCEKSPVEIVILSTNDMHAKIDNFGKVAAYISEQRRLHPNVIVLSGGDMFSGNPVVDQHEDKGFPIIDIMNKIGYQYTAIGNHEFDYNREFMKKRIEQSSYPWLCANIHISPEARIPQPKPYVIITVDGVKVAILGLIEISKTSRIPATHPDKVKGITFTDPIEEALSYRSLRDSCDLFIGLTHIGTYADVKLAEEMPELDVIIGGHSHTRIDTAMVINGVLITQTESWLKYIGKTTIVVENGKVISKENELIDVNTLTAEDIDISNLIKHYYETSGLNKVIAKNLSTIESKDALGSLMTDAITDLPGIEIAFQNGGGVRIHKLDEGDITIAKVYELDPFGNEVIIYQMTPAEIRELIFNAGCGKRADLLVSGITYIFPKDGKASDVILKTYDGENLNENKHYTVGMNSYIASSYNFPGSENGKSLYRTSADVLIEYLQKVKEVDYARISRVAVAE